MQAQSEELQMQSEELQAQSEEIQVQNEELQIQSEELREINISLHQSEDQFRALVKNLKSGVALIDETGMFAVVNPSFMQMFGLDNELDIFNINNQEWSHWEVYGDDGNLLHVDDHPVRKAIMTSKPVKDQLVAVHNPGAKELTWMLISAEPVLKEDGDIYRVICSYYDITEHKRAEDLQEIRGKLEAALESMTDAVFISDTQGNFINFNEAFATYHKFKSKEDCYKTLSEYPDYIDVYFADGTLAPLDMWAVPRALRGETVSDAEYILRRKDTGETWVGSYNFAPIRDEKGAIVGSVVVGRDITERKRTEEELKQSEKQYRTLGDTIPYGIWLTDATGYCTYVSSSFLELVDMSMEQVQEFGWLHLLPPEDVQPTADHWLRCIQTGENFEREHRFRAKDGSYRNVLAIGRPIKNEEGKITGWVGFNLDITERKQADEKLLKAYEQIRIQSEDLQVFNEELQVQSEELQETNQALHESEKRFRTLAENSPDMIIRFDRQNRHTYANPAAAKVYGLSQEEIVGKTYGELRRDPEQVRFWETYYEIVFATGKPETMEFQYTSPTGKEYYFSTSIVPEFVDGKVTSILTISHDITDIKEAEAKLKETLDNLEELVKERTAELEKAYKSLKESERGLAEAQKMAHIGNWDRNIITGEVHWSDEVYRIFGFKPQEFGVTYNSFLSYVHPDDRDICN